MFCKNYWNNKTSNIHLRYKLRKSEKTNMIDEAYGCVSAENRNYRKCMAKIKKSEFDFDSYICRSLEMKLRIRDVFDADTT